MTASFYLYLHFQPLSLSLSLSFVERQRTKAKKTTRTETRTVTRGSRNPCFSPCLCPYRNPCFSTCLSLYRNLCFSPCRFLSFGPLPYDATLNAFIYCNTLLCSYCMGQKGEAESFFLNMFPVRSSSPSPLHFSVLLFR